MLFQGLYSLCPESILRLGVLRSPLILGLLHAGSIRRGWALSFMMELAYENLCTQVVLRARISLQVFSDSSLIFLKGF